MDTEREYFTLNTNCKDDMMTAEDFQRAEVLSKTIYIVGRD